MKIKNKIHYKKIEELFGFTRQTWSKWQKENRPIVKLLNYFDDDDILELLNTGKIERLEITTFVQEQIRKACRDYIYFFRDDIHTLWHDFSLKFYFDYLVEIENISSSDFHYKIFLTLIHNQHLSGSELNKITTTLGDLLNKDFFKMIESVVPYIFANNMFQLVEVLQNTEHRNIAIKHYIYFNIFKHSKKSYDEDTIVMPKELAMIKNVDDIYIIEETVNKWIISLEV